MEIKWELLGIKNNWSFNSMANNDTTDFLKEYGNLIMPNAKLLGGVLLFGLYEIMFGEVKVMVLAQLYISSTSDGWSSFCLESWYCATAHWVDEKFNKQHATLGVFLMNGRHTGLKIANSVGKVINSFTGGKVPNTALVVDNGADVSKGATILVGELNVWHCFDHTLALVVKAVLENKLDIITDVRTIVISCRRKITTSEIIKEFNGTQYLNLPRDVATRWNSTFYMLKGFQRNQHAIREYMEENADEFDVPFPNTAVVDDLIEVFSFFYCFFLSECKKNLKSFKILTGITTI